MGIMREPAPTVIVVFGATGDLFRRKLARALFDLSRQELPSGAFRVVGLSRRPWGDAEYRNFVREILAKNEVDPLLLGRFLEKVFYIQGDLDDLASYKKIAGILATLDREAGACANKLLYLATPPSFYRKIFQRISQSGLSIPCVPDPSGRSVGWTRILVEKPFGNDLKEAKALDKLLGRLFEEGQIFRIDHYLAKETLQNILTFRFSNGLFEPLWNGRFIEKVEVKLFERGDAGERGEFYDPVGALKDVGQNHLLQMLALVAMDNPGRLASAEIREKRLAVLERLRPFARKAGDFAVRAQYGGYRKERGVAPDSETETYFKLKLAVANGRWRGVPFYLESGKALDRSGTLILVHFRPSASCLCPAPHDGGHGNVLTFSIQPEEAISVLFWSKKPGFKFGLEPKLLSFAPGESEERRRLPNDYERILFDAIRGDQTLFPSTREIGAQWKLIMKVLGAWRGVPLGTYPKGTVPYGAL